MGQCSEDPLAEIKSQPKLAIQMNASRSEKTKQSKGAFALMVLEHIVCQQAVLGCLFPSRPKDKPNLKNSDACPQR
jgi:hypothetical protein